MLRLCFAVGAAAVSGASEAVSLLQVTADRKVHEPKCKDVKQSFKAAKAALKSARQQAKAALAARKEAKEAFAALRQQKETVCGVPEAGEAGEGDPTYMPSCSEGTMKQGIPDVATGKPLFPRSLQSFGDVYLPYTHDFQLTGMSCLDQVYKEPRCQDALVAYVNIAGGKCYCATAKGNVGPKRFITRDDIAEEAGDWGKSEFDKISPKVAACYMDNKKKNSFSINPPETTNQKTPYCSADKNRWLKWKQVDEEKRFLLPKVPGQYTDAAMCMAMAATNPKCKWATRASLHSADCYCEWGHLDAAGFNHGNVHFTCVLKKE